VDIQHRVARDFLGILQAAGQASCWEAVSRSQASFLGIVKRAMRVLPFQLSDSEIADEASKLVIPGKRTDRVSCLPETALQAGSAECTGCAPGLNQREREVMGRI
jgi:hypothetical protein